MAKVAALPLSALREFFGSALQENVSLSNYTTARVGGPVDALIPVNSAAELERAGMRLWELGAPFLVLGSGSNVLVSDEGLRSVVILNRARNIKIDAKSAQPSVWAESGANFSSVARQTALRGCSGLEWAAAVPGTVGGAVYGNAGAFGGDVQGSLLVADILHPKGKTAFTAEQMGYAYRSSRLKREQAPAIILSARLRLVKSDRETATALVEANSRRRRASQPLGASLGSMFKNPPGDYAGRLIEAAGLKGARIGDAEISSIHANFFINHGHATAGEIGQLLRLAREKVFEQTGVKLELEIELLGNWPEF